MTAGRAWLPTSAGFLPWTTDHPTPPLKPAVLPASGVAAAPPPVMVARERCEVGYDVTAWAAGRPVTWDFGDGRADAGTAGSHSYATPGAYTIRLVTAASTGTVGGEYRFDVRVG